MIETQQFAGAAKTNTSFLTPLERRLATTVLPHIPSCLETYHLTMLTLVWSGLILLFLYWAGLNRPSLAFRWSWSIIFFQYVTDHYDGENRKIPRNRLVRWATTWITY